jgi:hypothetical protein
VPPLTSWCQKGQKTQTTVVAAAAVPTNNLLVPVGRFQNMGFLQAIDPKRWISGFYWHKQYFSAYCRLHYCNNTITTYGESDAAATLKHHPLLPLLQNTLTIYNERQKTSTCGYNNVQLASSHYCYHQSNNQSPENTDQKTPTRMHTHAHMHPTHKYIPYKTIRSGKHGKVILYH